MISDNFKKAILLYVYYMGGIDLWIRVYKWIDLGGKSFKWEGWNFSFIKTTFEFKSHFFSEKSRQNCRHSSWRYQITAPKFFFWISDIIYGQIANRILNLIQILEFWLHSIAFLCIKLFSRSNIKQVRVQLGSKKFKRKV